MNSAPSKEKSKRRLLLVVVALITALIQHTPGFSPDIGRLSPMLFVPFVVSVAMYENNLAGLAFGFISGALWDFASSGADGMYTLLLTVIGFGVGVLVSFYLRNRLLSAVVLSAVASAAVSVIYWFIFVLRKGYDGAWSLLFSHFLPLALYSTLFVFVYYYLIRFIMKSTVETESRRR